jgi:hypothetical protein
MTTSVITTWLLSTAYAATAPVNIGVHGTTSSSIDPRFAIKNLGGIALDALTYLTGAVAVIFLMYYGIQYISSQGSPEKTKVARAGVINAILGIIIITASNGIIRLALTGGELFSGLLSSNASDSSGATNSTTPSPAAQPGAGTAPDPNLIAFKNDFINGYIPTPITGSRYKKRCYQGQTSDCLTNDPAAGSDIYGEMVTCINGATIIDAVTQCVSDAGIKSDKLANGH